MLKTLGKRKVFSEVNAVLEQLSRHYILCIGSTTDTEPLLQDIINNRIPIKNIYTSESLRVYKPKSRFYTAISEDIGISPEEILFVGDSLVDDIFGPSQVGMKTCFVNRRSAEAGSFSPDYTVKTLQELLTQIQG